MELLHQLEASGLQLSVTDRGTIRAVGDVASLEKWSPTIRERKTELLDLLELWDKLECAVTECCLIRGDDEKNRAELLANCRCEPADSWPWFIWYFQQEAMRWTH